MTRTFAIASAILLSPSALAQQAMDHSNMQHGEHAMTMGADHSAMTGAFGAYPSGRDSSGTSWAPDITDHGGVHSTAGDWMLMGHAALQGV